MTRFCHSSLDFMTQSIANYLILKGLNGALGEIRTPDTLVRSQFHQYKLSIKSAACDVTDFPTTAKDSPRIQG